MTNPKLRIWRHILLITLLVLIAYRQKSYSYEDYSDLMGDYLYVVVLATCIIYLSYAYINRYFLVPRFLLNKKYKSYLAGLLLMLFIHITYTFGSEYIIRTFIGVDRGLDILDLSVSGLVVYSILLLFILATAVVPIFKHHLQEKQRVNKMEQDHVKSELDRLKEQISPTFLSNILNRTSVLVKTDSTKASMMLMKLGCLLRYQLYDCARDKVLLSAEINFLKGYLELVQLYSNQFEYNLKVDDSIKEIFVSPLIFIPFIQQSANHIEYTDEIVSLDLCFEMENSKLIFSCQSNYDEILSKSEFYAIKKRLNLIYPNNYSLIVDNGETKLYLNIIS